MAAPAAGCSSALELGAGAHVGPAGRYDRLRYEAEVLAFIMASVSLPQSITKA